ncbi:MAG: glycosyltransferase family 4 protein [Prevotella sp.]|nr:glycosyltransferase family 4 protein [Prevotella sp.]
MARKKIVYCTPSLYTAGGVERVLTSKVNYLAEKGDEYDVTMILTDGAGKAPFYPLSEKVRVINLDIGFEALWELSFLRKIPAYLKKQRQYKRRLREELMRLRPDITISTLRREVNFITSLPDGSKKVGELHVNRQNYRNFEANDTNVVKRLFAKWWSWRLVGKLRRLDRFVVLTNEDRLSWHELSDVTVIPNPLPKLPDRRSPLTEKRIIAVGRYAYQKGFDLLLEAWSRVEKQYPDWHLTVFGAGERVPYEQLARELMPDTSRYELRGAVEDIGKEYLASSVFVFSSRFEGFGMALLEAMSYGLPAISFDCPCGPKDIVSNGRDGMLVESGNVAELAEAMSRMISDADLRQRLADEAVKTAREYDIKAIGKRWDELFGSLVP